MHLLPLVSVLPLPSFLQLPVVVTTFTVGYYYYYCRHRQIHNHHRYYEASKWLDWSQSPIRNADDYARFKPRPRESTSGTRYSCNLYVRRFLFTESKVTTRYEQVLLPGTWVLKWPQNIIGLKVTITYSLAQRTAPVQLICKKCTKWKPWMWERHRISSSKILNRLYQYFAWEWWTEHWLWPNYNPN
jgi:hypothetical protein